MKILCLLFFLILTGSCVKRDQSEHSLYITVINEFQLDDRAKEYASILYPIAASSTQGEFLALSNVQNPIAVLIVDYKGNLISRIGNVGRGPDEIQSARYFGFDTDNSIVINDKTQALIKRYTLNADFLTSYETDVERGISIRSRIFNTCNNYWFLGVSEFKKDASEEAHIIGVFDSDFRLLELFGEQDPYMKGKRDSMSDVEIHVNCNDAIVYVTQNKIPFIQMYDLNTYERVARIENIPPSFRLSPKFQDMITDREERIRFLTEEQSISVHIGSSDKFIYHVFRNDSKRYYRSRSIRDRNEYVAVYSKDDHTFLGEFEVEGIIIGFTNEGYLINYTDDTQYQFKLLHITESRY